ncbi:MAG TPA: rhodanese-like domain-containing protein [Polyangia bacterium]|nr:rhodanese-like domain-containing protein [Polyangia bacterium]
MMTKTNARTGVGGLGIVLCAVGLTGIRPSQIAAAPPAAGPPTVYDGTLRDGDPIPEINTKELQRALKTSDATVLDARPFDEYAVSHIPGARSVPGKPGLAPAQYTADTAEVIRTIPDRNRPLILYCNGPFCGRSKRFGAELLKVGYKDVRRYQLGIPTWRALGGVTQVEREALVSLMRADTTAVLVDARDSGGQGTPIPGARAIPLRDASKAKDDGRLPMTDHNTRIFVVGDTGSQSRAVAEAIARDAFHNVSFFDGTVADVPELTAHPVRAKPAAR